MGEMNYIYDKNGIPRVEGKTREELILEFQPDAMRQTHRYIYNNPSKSEDIVGEANLALVMAVDHWVANRVDDNLAKVVCLFVSRKINDYVLTDKTVKIPKSVKEKPETVSATVTDADGSYYEDFTLDYEQVVEDSPLEAMLRSETLRSMNLSYRERTILMMRAEGYTQKEIAEALKITQPRIYHLLAVILERFERVSRL